MNPLETKKSHWSVVFNEYNRLFLQFCPSLDVWSNMTSIEKSSLNSEFATFWEIILSTNGWNYQEWLSEFPRFRGFNF